MKATLLLAFSLLTLCSFGQKDSIMLQLGVYDYLEGEATLDDSVVAKQIEEEIHNIKYQDPKRAEYFARLEYSLSKKIDYKVGICNGLRLMGDLMMIGDNLDSSLIYVQQSLDLSIKYGLEYQELKANYSIGNYNFYTSDYQKALEYYFIVDGLAREKYPTEIGGAANGIGLIYRVIENNEKSKHHFQEAYRYGKIYKDTADMLQAINNLGIIAKNEDSTDLALSYYSEGIELSEASNNIRRKGEILYNISVVYQKIGDEEKALEYMEKSAEITELIGNARGKALDYYVMGHYLLEKGRFREAKPKMELALKYGIEADYTELILEAYNSLGAIHNKLGNYKDAYFNSQMAYNYKDTLNLAAANSDAMEMENRIQLERLAVKDSLEREKLELEKDHQKKIGEEQVKARESLLWASGIIIILFILGLVFVIRSRAQMKKKNQIITERNEIITEQKEQIEEVHKEITDSINYAQRIQGALLAGNVEWDKISKDHFILFRPKDVVSGDFYWAHHSEADNKSIWVVADCTGHGVPGAFMSMLGIGFLNEIIIENGNRNGGDILDQLRSKIVNALTQKGDQKQKDGMDMALCIWDRSTNELEFAGANNNLYLIRKSAEINEDDFDKVMKDENGDLSLAEIKANKMPVGFQSDAFEPFKSEKIQLKEGDVVVAYTDGYADQFGGDKGKKMKYKPFKEKLLSNVNMPFKLQGEILQQAFDEWKGELEQIDDVCVIGVKV